MLALFSLPASLAMLMTSCLHLYERSCFRIRALALWRVFATLETPLCFQLYLLLLVMLVRDYIFRIQLGQRPTERMSFTRRTDQRKSLKALSTLTL
jgi:hypothetical protein